MCVWRQERPLLAGIPTPSSQSRVRYGVAVKYLHERRLQTWTDGEIENISSNCILLGARYDLNISSRTVLNKTADTLFPGPGNYNRVT